MVLKIVAESLARPLLVAYLCAGVGLLLKRTSRRRTAVWVVALSGVLAYLASTSLVGNALLAPLEHQFDAFDPAQSAGVRDIVVLGSGYEPYGRIPVTGALDAEGLARVVEAVRLARARPGARLLLSGGAPSGFTASAVGYAELALDLGIQRSSMVVLDRALDTNQEARDVVSVLGQSPFILVTSAYHMPRAMRLMHRVGANPVPAPTGQILHAPREAGQYGLIPGSSGLRKTEIALHEYLGIAAIRLGIN